MAPNLAVLAFKIASPQRWFKSKHTRTTSNEGHMRSSTTEHWTSPVPGTYELGRGAKWFLIERDDDPSQPEKPDQVIWCKALDRKLLLSDYRARSRKGKLPPPRSQPSSQTGGSRRPSRGPSREPSIKEPARPDPHRSSSQEVVPTKPQPEVSFVMMDDGVTWLNDRDADGEQTMGPWLRYCIDRVTGEFRPMRVSDDPRRSVASTERSRSVSTMGLIDDASGESKISLGLGLAGGASREPSVRKVAEQVHEAVPEHSVVESKAD